MFLKSTLSRWREHFTVRKDRFVDMLMLGERKISLAAKARTDAENSELFDVEWVPTVDGREISKESIYYIIQNATPTTVINITLHPDAYARLADDAEIVAALEAQPLVSLVCA